MAFDNYDDIKVGDVIECFDVEEVQFDPVVETSSPARIPARREVAPP